MTSILNALALEVYSLPNIETATAATYRRQLKLYLIPAFGGMAVEDITTDDIQALFNSMTGTKATKQKARMVLNMILEAAVEDGLLPRNPLKSRRIKLTGEVSKVTKEYTVEQMRFLVRNLENVKNATDRAYLAIQALHPLRLEEVLGLKWGDVDLETMTLYVRRAVTHPTRNQPEIKATKTEASVRAIGLSGIAARFLVPGDENEFIFGGSTPFTYQKGRVPFSTNNSEHFLKLQLSLEIRIFEEFTIYFSFAAQNSLKKRISPLGKVFAIFGTRPRKFAECARESSATRVSRTISRRFASGRPS